MGWCQHASAPTKVAVHRFGAQKQGFCCITNFLPSLLASSVSFGMDSVRPRDVTMNNTNSGAEWADNEMSKTLTFFPQVVFEESHTQTSTTNPCMLHCTRCFHQHRMHRGHVVS